MTVRPTISQSWFSVDLLLAVANLHISNLQLLWRLQIYIYLICNFSGDWSDPLRIKKFKNKSKYFFRRIYTDNVAQLLFCFSLLCIYVLLALARDVLPCIVLVTGLQVYYLSALYICSPCSSPWCTTLYCSCYRTTGILSLCSVYMFSLL